MKCLGLALILCLVTTAQAAIYRWQDGSGNTQYGDSPPADSRAELVDLPELSTYAPPEPAAEAIPSTVEPVTEAVPATVQRYHRMAITQPVNGQTLRTDDGRLTVAVDLRPVLQEAAGHRLIAVLDGRRLPGGSSSISIRAARGSHRLQVAVIDPDGKVVAKSRVIGFDVRPKTRLPMPSELGDLPGLAPDSPVAAPLPVN